MVFVVANLVMGLLFAIAAALQHNDPDPLRWMAVYGLAAACCFYALARPQRFEPPAVVGAAAIVWAAIVAPEAIAHGDLERIATSMSAADPGVELMRELLGLAGVALWMGVLAWRARRLVPSAQ